MGILSCEVIIIMQLIFDSKTTPKQYYQCGYEYSFPKPYTCLHPDCKIPVPPRPHGYYIRNVITLGFNGRILIRRYYCKYCGHTFSYLPSFCLPYFQYSLVTIFLALLWHYLNLIPLLKVLTSRLQWQRQHLQFYRRRFKANLKFIKAVLRQMMPQVILPKEDDIKKEARKVLIIVKTGFGQIQAFSTRFFTQSNNTFMASRKLA
ncbi:hypothetical protein Dred_1011 [Desulforamulus reducens MI-1]|uniref:DUF6431 domain-containing protein n=1 Tax=Desulforamulus reducens (strain ATCC BAA-1160 / DSM 100696 / MI-1) TaxID=349161 RepID=A4J1X2_DESRM|nr:hypothetical protein Dred_0531 [Desulforamulus reducens MI-1]ABO49546.1 hypothetical protein Dred_1011 [Desulforamulus reducens MI-1]